ncbi:hypothetical protein THAR02_03140 [Trichoderma harzianum]|uniref:Uncharacterized protein n=1 Tax=Trichoderma harzianum TaxID=5544 RepID=A0A0F9XXJ4_TRIHA|nr:hypothetical protein THAR02_03140 [Trichoderma harzianum]
MRLLAHDMTKTQPHVSPQTTLHKQGGLLIFTHTHINGKVHRVNRRHRQNNRHPPRRIAPSLSPREAAHNLPREAQHQQARRHNHRPDHHQRSAPAPARRALIGHDADDGLHDEAGQRAGDPDERRVALGEAQVEEVGRAVWMKALMLAFISLKMVILSE